MHVRYKKIAGIINQCSQYAHLFAKGYHLAETN